jgi:hypothetical protein
MRKAQAVLLIHGIGEQRPMDTLRSFVDAVWKTDTELHNKDNPHGRDNVWSKPDTVSESFELRRLTTPKNANGIETDFYEFYWAHLMEGTTYGHVVAWAKALLWRNPSTVPKQLRLAYGVLVTLLLIAVGLTIYTLLNIGDSERAMSPWVSALLTVVLLPAAGLVVKAVLGDAARYLHVAPTNIQCRHEIRHAGVKLLKELHKRGYERIIVVGHSLGSVIGYDILTHAWPTFNAADPVDAQKVPVRNAPVAALEKLEQLAVELADGKAPTSTIADAQRDYFRELKANGSEWRVSDFVTAGSPLAHAAILLARDGKVLKKRIVDRELPSCLPDLETVQRNKVDVRRFSYDADGTHRKPNHSAVFGPTRWTNLYFPCRFIVRGDVVGGEICGVLGRSVKDVAVTTTLRKGFLSHTRYWTPEKRGPAQHIAALRTALDLGDKSGVVR